MTPLPPSSSSRRVRRWLAAWCASLTVALVVLAALAPAASAHAVLQESSPGNGATVQAAPTQVTVRFDEAVTISAGSLRVFDADGHRVDAGLPRHGDHASTVEVDVKDHLAKGTYLVAWRVISADTHPVHGGFEFNYGHPTDVAASTVKALFASTADRPYQVAGAILRWFSYLTALFAAGGMVFLLFAQQDLGRESTRRLVTWSALAAIPLAAAAIPIQAALATGEGFGSITQHGVFGEAASDGLGIQIVVVGLGALAIVLAVRRLTGQAQAIVGYLGAAATSLGFVLAGHSRTTDPEWLVVPTDIAHLAAAAVWFAGVVLLVVVVRRRTAETTRDAVTTVVRFSSLATVAVFVVSIAGLVLAWREVGSIHALVSTTYGWLVIAKMGLAALIIWAGAYNHYRLLPALERE
ncbi:MAG TPA: copper resistance protein CopC, partial [Acidimicrobiales bacterium]